MGYSWTRLVIVIILLRSTDNSIERFRSMAAIYYRGSQAALIVYDITNMDSFNDIRIWLDELRRNMTSDLIVHVVGAKSDLASTQRAVPIEYAKKTVRQWVSLTSPNSPDQATQPSSPPLSMNTQNNYFDSKTPPNRQQGSRTLSGLGFGRGKRSAEETRGSTPDENGPAWCEVDVSEVSAKDDYGQSACLSSSL